MAITLGTPMVTNQVSKVTITPYKADGTIGIDEFILDNIIAGTFAIVQEADTLNNIDRETDDIPIKVIPVKGAFNINLQTADIQPEILKNMFGATITGDTVALPASAVQLHAKVEVEFEDGYATMVVYKGFITSNIDGTDLKTSAIKGNVSIRAMKDNAGKFVEFEAPTVTP